MNDTPKEHFDAIVVGAGFAGLYALYRLRGLGLSARVLERGGGVGGTWYFNRYPGARCDIESLQYSYQFSDELAQEWEWSERYSAQPEILEYANHVADRFDLKKDIQFHTSVAAASFDEKTSRWNVKTADGKTLAARFLIMATGCLSAANVPEIAGRESFAGATYHTGQWPHEGVNFTGLDVGVIGTGSSAIQAIPLIAEQAKHLTVFQRTPNYAVPAHNGPLDREEERRIKADYRGFRERNAMTGFDIAVEMSETPAFSVEPEERKRAYDERWKLGGFHFLGAFNDLLFDPAANDTAAQFVREKIHEIVKDPAVAEKLSPHHLIGTKRLCVDTGYYATFNRPNVALVDLNATPIEAIVPEGVRTVARSYDLDAIVFATGFDAMTGALDRIDIRGRRGVKLKDAWAAGPKTYLGLATSGFPNLFMITAGPGSPSVLSNMIPSIEQHVNFVTDCIGYMGERQLGTIEASEEAEAAWVSHVNEVANLTLFPQGNSWYVGANIPGKLRMFLPYIGGYPVYVAKCNDVAAKGYEGFTLAPQG
jgi:cation diffusion facilitator CzcD-associated flavoprotein CzcO